MFGPFHPQHSHSASVLPALFLCSVSTSNGLLVMTWPSHVLQGKHEDDTKMASTWNCSICLSDLVGFRVFFFSSLMILFTLRLLRGSNKFNTSTCRQRCRLNRTPLMWDVRSTTDKGSHVLRRFLHNKGNHPGVKTQHTEWKKSCLYTNS